MYEGLQYGKPSDFIGDKSNYAQLNKVIIDDILTGARNMYFCSKSTNAIIIELDYYMEIILLCKKVKTL